jgi:hypothetical protein
MGLEPTGGRWWISLTIKKMLISLKFPLSTSQAYKGTNVHQRVSRASLGRHPDWAQRDATEKGRDSPID